MSLRKESKTEKQGIRRAKSALATFCVALVAFSSCEKDMSKMETEAIAGQEAHSQKSLGDIPVRVENGTLHFESEQDLRDALLASSQMGERELDAWEERLGFTSFRRAASKAESLLARAANEEEFLRILNDNAHLLELVGDTIVERLETNPVWARLFSTERTLAVGGRLIDSHTASSKGVITATFDAGDCGDINQYVEFYNDRRMVRLNPYGINPDGIVSFFFAVTSYKKVWGIWIKYETTIRVDGIEMRLRIVDAFGASSIVTLSKGFEQSSGEVNELISLLGSVSQFGKSEIKVISSKGSAWTRGVENWYSMECQEQ